MAKPSTFRPKNLQTYALHTEETGDGAVIDLVGYGGWIHLYDPRIAHVVVRDDRRRHRSFCSLAMALYSARIILRAFAPNRDKERFCGALSKLIGPVEALRYARSLID